MKCQMHEILSSCLVSTYHLLQIIKFFLRDDRTEHFLLSLLQYVAKTIIKIYFQDYLRSYILHLICTHSEIAARITEYTARLYK